MSDTVDSAPAAAPLALTAVEPQFFMKRDDPKTPCVVTLPGSSNMNLKPFNVTATGTAKPESPGTLTLTLYGRASFDGATDDPENWLPLASTNGEPIGGETDLPEAMFMLRLEDMMTNTKTGKMQGTFKSNVASSPYAAIDIEQHPGDITDEDPLYIFALAASFSPDEEPPATKDGEEPPPLCSLTLAGLILSA